MDHRRSQHDQPVKGIQGKAINNEFIQEVEVKTGGYQPEYGRALGGVINVITKSGGNAFHGDGFVYYDSSGTAAEERVPAGRLGHRPRARRRRSPRRLRRRSGRLPARGPALDLRRLQPCRPSGRSLACRVVDVRVERGPVSVRLDGVSLLGKADLERRGLDVGGGHRLRGSVHELRRRGRRSAPGPWARSSSTRP